MSTLWDKGTPVDALVHAFTVGQDFEWDQRLVTYDVKASIAHAHMLASQGYFLASEADAVAACLRDLAASHARGEWRISREEEDCHTALELRLTERLGELGKKIHLGRSRNDQVLTALRLYLLDEVAHLEEAGRGVLAGLDAWLAAEGDVPMPGYTHQQRAMPSSLGLFVGGYRTEIADDLEGLSACRRRLSKNPLGSAAGYGTPGLALDRTATTLALGFESVHAPVTAVQLSRGKAEAEVCFALTLLLQDIGRLASELCLFATAEFGFLKLPEAFTTGSSIMPQKRNPDIFELVRGSAAQITGELIQVLAIPSKLPSGYHRDLQLIKGPLFRTLDSARAVLLVMGHALPELRLVKARLLEAMDPTLDATEEAYRLVTEEGLSFREAYRRVAAELSALPDEDLVGSSEDESD